MQNRNEANICVIDVSRHQGAIDWLRVASAGVQGAFVKASEGVGYIDPMFRRNAVGAPAAGLKLGFYHYCRPETGNTAVQEAESFLSIIDGLPSELPHVLDVEGTASELGTEALTAWCVEWLQAVEKQSDHRAMVYTGAHFARSHLGAALSAWPLWVAHYGVDIPLSNNTWDWWSVFQFTSVGQIVGINGNVDVNEVDLAFWNELFPPHVPVEIPAEVQTMSQEDANTIIRFLSAGWFATENEDARAEFKRLANELRKVSGQPEE